MSELITTAGIAAAVAAGSSGPLIDVATIRLGSGYNYTPTLGQTAFVGTQVYSAAPSAYTIIDANTVEFRLTLNPDLGGFSFGEIGLFLADGTLFAIKALPTLEVKIAEPTVGWNVIVCRMRLQLTNLPGLINWNFYNTSIGRIMELANWTLLEEPDSVTLQSNAFIVHQPDEYGTEPLVYLHGTTWNVSTHQIVKIAAGSRSIVSRTSSQIVANSSLGISSVAAGRYIIQLMTGTQAGQIRAVTSVSGATVNWSPAFNATPALTDQFEIRESNSYFAAFSAATQGRQVGDVYYRAANDVPDSLSKPADGRLLDRTYYAALFAKIGTTYSAGDGTTFGLPDLRGVVIRGYDGGRGKDAGRVFGSYQDDAVQNITGAFNTGGRDVPAVSGAFALGGGLSEPTAVSDVGATDTSRSISLDASRVVRTASETRMKNVALLPCIVVLTGNEVGDPPADAIPLGTLVITPTTASRSYAKDASVGTDTVATYTPTGAVTITLTSGTLATGLAISASGGNIQITGTPTVAGSTSATYHVYSGTHEGYFVLNVTVIDGSVNITDQTVTAYSIAGVATAGYRLNSNGKVQTEPYDPNWTDAETWLLTGTNSSFEGRATLVSGDTPTTGTLATWQVLSSTRAWTLQQIGGGTLSCHLTIEIRNAGGPGVLDSAEVYLTADVGV